MRNHPPPSRLRLDPAHAIVCTVHTRQSGTIIAGFGTDLVERWENSVGQSGGPIGAYWSSHGVETMVRMTSGQTITMRMESGATNDCLYETSFFYGHLNVLLYFADA